MADLVKQYDLERNGQQEGKVQIYSENSGYWAFLCRKDGKYYSHIRVSDERNSISEALRDSQKKLHEMGYCLGHKDVPTFHIQDVLLFEQERVSAESALASS